MKQRPYHYHTFQQPTLIKALLDKWLHENMQRIVIEKEAEHACVADINEEEDDESDEHDDDGSGDTIII